MFPWHRVYTRHRVVDHKNPGGLTSQPRQCQRLAIFLNAAHVGAPSCASNNFRVGGTCTDQGSKLRTGKGDSQVHYDFMDIFLTCRQLANIYRIKPIKCHQNFVRLSHLSWKGVDKYNNLNKVKYCFVL